MRWKEKPASSSNDYATIRKRVRRKDGSIKKNRIDIMQIIFKVGVISNLLEDALIDGLSFKLAKPSSYITDRVS